jgi:hypothetical protein
MTILGTNFMSQYLPGGRWNSGGGRRMLGGLGMMPSGYIPPGYGMGRKEAGNGLRDFLTQAVEGRRARQLSQLGRDAIQSAQFEAGRIQPEDYTSSSYSGLSPWADQALSGVVGKMTPGMMRGYQAALKGLDQAPETIEQRRQELNTQFARDIQMPTMNAVRNATAAAAGRGVLGGTSYNDQVGQIAQGANAAAAQQQSASNVWAADALMKNMLDRLSARQSGMALLGDMAGMGRYSQSTDPTAWMRLGGFTGPAQSPFSKFLGK